MALHFTDERPLETGEQVLVVLDEREVHVDAGADGRIGKVGGREPAPTR